jgi:DNA polymerase I-like protein with 3'-5' exonuclease and polymerase domains
MEELCAEHNFITTIHDSLMFMPEVGKKDRCIEAVYRIMTQATTKLRNEATGPEGLKVGVEVSVGKNWREMKEIKI